MSQTAADSKSKTAKILVVGSVNGHLAEFFAKIKKLDAKHGPFSFLLISGNLFGCDADSERDVDMLLKDEITVPIMTYALVGDRRLPERIETRAGTQSGEICNNIVMLSGHGVLQTSEGLRIAYIGGRYIGQVQAELKNRNGCGDSEQGDSTNTANEHHDAASDMDGSIKSKEDKQKGPSADNSDLVSFDRAAISSLVTRVATENEKAFHKTMAQPSIDILLTYDWPYGVVLTNSLSSKEGSDGVATVSASNKISNLSALIMPRYHFAAGEGLFYERLPWKYSDRIKVGRGSEEALHFTRFIGLGAAGDSKHGKQRWFYAMNAVPLQLASQGSAAPSGAPSNCTPNPLHRFSKFNATLDTKNLSRALLHIDISGGSDDRNAVGSKQSKRPPPPLSYICHGCSQPGHWIGDCPTRDQQQNKRQRTDDKPPPGYKCHQCKQSGHWRADCTSADNGGGTAAVADAQASCWFCLANPDVDQNLMVAIGDEAYVAMAKGALVVSGDKSQRFQHQKSPVPGGAHVLVVPIVHTDSLRRVRESADDTDTSLCTEIDKWMDAITALFAEHDCVPLAFETCRCLPHVHTTVQMIPIPKAKAAEVRPMLEKICASDRLRIEDSYPSSTTAGYFTVSDPGNSGKPLFVHIPPKTKRFNLQLGRKLAAQILGIPEREDWRQCIVSEEIEASERDKFISAFSKHDFTR
ncbi:hypothetical protein IW140_004925 [Coemansia sp. RSA 1813]|nr:hypothetical protein EV178_005218 [Coemansia sp. RSA 1646]KAJ1771914.1 hypothetical protein LPJ74_001948 [Coemansia sp. RSA 1843]KAJ2087377.1 hypothetical protein IW138_004994 [Coemansia sp. RSA 986]KAJ2212248.1 hypothetical protein EV179_004799 [Coemansia sp. RSA 487]KAJ2566456.1 hypothetical protein IW140_004925 [Coemansia sp. RSA 1813]